MSQRTLDAVREAQGAGVEPWNTADSQGSQRAPRKCQRNRRAARRFLDRLRFELLQGGSGGDGHRHPEDANDGDEDGERSEDEEMPDRTTEPGPSEQPPETGHPNEGSQTDDEFTVMDVEEEQPEDEAPQPPRKRGRFENERSDPMSQGEERGRASSITRARSR